MKIEKEKYLYLCRKIGIQAKRIEAAIKKEKPLYVILSIFQDALTMVEQLPLEKQKKHRNKLPL